MNDDACLLFLSFAVRTNGWVDVDRGVESGIEVSIDVVAEQEENQPENGGFPFNFVGGLYS